MSNHKYHHKALALTLCHPRISVPKSSQEVETFFEDRAKLRTPSRSLQLLLVEHLHLPSRAVQEPKAADAGRGSTHTHCVWVLMEDLQSPLCTRDAPNSVSAPHQGTTVRAWTDICIYTHLPTCSLTFTCSTYYLCTVHTCAGLYAVLHTLLKHTAMIQVHYVIILVQLSP